MLDDVTPEVMRSLNEQAGMAENGEYSAEQLRKLAEENEFAARRLLEEA